MDGDLHKRFPWLDMPREEFMKYLRSGTFKQEDTLLGYPVVSTPALDNLGKDVEFGGYLVPQTVNMHTTKPISNDVTDNVVHGLIAHINDYAEQHNISLYGGDDGCLDIEVDGRRYTAIIRTPENNLELLDSYIDLTEPPVKVNIAQQIIGAVRKEGGE